MPGLRGTTQMRIFIRVMHSACDGLAADGVRRPDVLRTRSVHQYFTKSCYALSASGAGAQALRTVLLTNFGGGRNPPFALVGDL